MSSIAGSLRARSSAPPICLESVVGCHYLILLQLGDISTLDAWKKRGTEAGSLDVMALVQRATTAIKSSLLTQLMRLGAERGVLNVSLASILLSPSLNAVGQSRVCVPYFLFWPSM